MKGSWIALTALALALLAAPAAQADWSGDSKGDVLAVASDGRLLQYRGTGAGGFATATGEPIGAGWKGFTAVFTTGDFSGDGRADLLARQTDGTLLMYRGDGGGGFQTGNGERIGAGWQSFTALLGPGDWTGDGKADILARTREGALLLYRGNGAGGFLTGKAEAIGSGWAPFTALLAPGDWSGDGKADLLARGEDGALYLYRGNGAGGFISPYPQVGSGWQGFDALASGGDFSGDGKPDVLARRPSGALFLYRGDGAGGFISPYPQVGGGWQSLSSLMVISGPAVPPPPPPPPAVGNVRLQAGLRCTPPGGLLKVGLKVRRRSGRKAARVRRVVFYVKGGPRRVDHRRPYVVRLRMNRPAGQKGRVFARVVFKRKGSKKLRRKTVSRRFAMCR